MLCEAKLVKDGTDPFDLFSSFGRGNIFCLAGGKGNSLLLTCAPGNEASTKGTAITADRAPSVGTTGQNAIRICEKTCGVFAAKNEA